MTFYRTIGFYYTVQIRRVTSDAESRPLLITVFFAQAYDIAAARQFD